MSMAEEKEFVIKHVFTDVPSIKNYETCHGNKENHFNIPWKIKMCKGTYFDIYLDCRKFCGVDDWSINATVNMKLFKKTKEELLVKNLNFSSKKEPYQLLKKIASADKENYLIDGNLTIELNVKLTETTGIKEKLWNFHETDKEFSDVVLIVNAEKFHVSKKYLARHSAYFKSLFSGNFDESKQSEITLTDIDAYDFQNFLEVLHGEPAVDEDTVEGILKLADMYDSKTAIHRCEEFYMNKSERTLKVKFDIAIKYKMDKLKKKCISGMKTKSAIRSVMPKNSSELDASVWQELLDRSLSLE